MIISINNKPLQLTNASNIMSMLQQLQFGSAKGIAIAINDQVVPRSQWESHSIQENDRVTIIRATQGG